MRPPQCLLFPGSLSWRRRALGFLVIGLGLAGTGFAVDTPPATAKARRDFDAASSETTTVGSFLNDLLPIGWQKRPQIHYNVFTEMTPAGREFREPTADRPVYYAMSPGRFMQLGLAPTAGEKPPPAEDLEATMKKALADNGFLPTRDAEQRPDIVIILTFGSFGSWFRDPAEFSEDFVDALLKNPYEVKDVLERARLIGGPKFAAELEDTLRWEAFSNVKSPEWGSPFQVFRHSGEGDRNMQLVELAFHTCYFVIAAAYDFNGVERKEKVPLWQTRMAVGTLGVDLREVLRPLIVQTGAALGHETPEAVLTYKRLDRTGRVEIGETTVIESGVSAPSEKSGK